MMNAKFKKFVIRLLPILVAASLALAACGAPAAPTEEPAVETAPVQETAAPEPVETEEAAAPTEPAEEPTEEAVEPTEEAPAEPSALRIAISTNIDSFDPHLTRSFAVANVVDYMVETLVNADENGDIVPVLAREWEISEDGTEITFFLQEGVQFHDGTPFNAEAVKYNIERFLDEDLPNTKNPYDRITEVRVDDEYTVTLVLEQPSSEMLPAMSNTNIAMISPASVPEGSEAYLGIGTEEPIGTGPYTLKEYVPDDVVVVERYSDYWGEQPYHDEVVFRIVPEAATRESLLLSGEVDIAVLPPLTDLPALEANPDITVDNGESARIIFIGLNMTSEYLDDPRVRQALNYAVDKEAIVQNILLGNAVPVVSPMPRSFFGFCETTPAYDYDPERARELLEEADVPEGLELQFISSNGRYAQDFQVAQAVVGYLADVGINVNLQTMDWGTYMDNVLVEPEQANRDLYLLGWAGGYPHGSHTMALVQSGAFFNRGYYNNPDVDELILQADAATTQEESAELYCQANQIIWEEAPWIFLYQQGYPVAYSADLSSVVVLPSEKFDTFDARPAE